ncbi:hypothetical protein GUITHDRAFT_102454 [Guillardia theta CCMP2712]|uniref:Uncharacterized protein n=1 Tax=Guillardia theta (strain CCMP2712) TaxID=905079 RepID=L1JUT7_GUITC|nr:hypothetical protein GUITHDRAFT_102454 [Guillardia theta CCMP2712]EKX51843.1 hypothetical protein GUITHDRAFT_102454 [Guillardia theta CCMP2712]|eukprot:XP_005838823.1 hypothetical protein GUITHDRAFT_102454 [Guillardia theta CCMP2712]
MFGIFTQLLSSPEAMYTHPFLSNGNAASYPGPGFFTSTPSELKLNSVTYDGQDSECRDGPASGMGQNQCH